MTEIFEFLISFIICYLMMRVALALFNANQAIKQEQRNNIRKWLHSVVHSIKEERHGEQIYWFDKDTDNFIVQGKSFDDIVKNLQRNYNDHIFIIDDRFILSGPDWIPQENKPIDLKMVDK